MPEGWGCAACASDLPHSGLKHAKLETPGGLKREHAMAAAGGLKGDGKLLARKARMRLHISANAWHAQPIYPICRLPGVTAPDPHSTIPCRLVTLQ